jgi:hypothetical protein
MTTSSLDSSSGDFLTEQSSLRQTQTDREVKRTALERAEALIKIEAIAQQELDLRRAEFRKSLTVRRRPKPICCPRSRAFADVQQRDIGAC